MPEAAWRLLEGLLATDDVGRCARHALQWLTRWAGAGAALCLEVSGEGRAEFAPVASVGVPGTAVHRFTFGLDRRDDPLVSGPPAGAGAGADDAAGLRDGGGTTPRGCARG